MFGPGVTREFVARDGYKAVKVVIEGPEATAEYYYVAMNAADEEPVTVRDALLDGLAGTALVNFAIPEEEGGLPLAWWEANLPLIAQWLADFVDFFTTGSAEAPIEKTITSMAGKLHSWTYIIPVASDAAWYAVLFQATITNYSPISLGTSVLAQAFQPPQAGKTGAAQVSDAGAIKELTQAVKDLAHKSIVVSMDNGRPRLNVTSNEILEEP